MRAVLIHALVTCLKVCICKYPHGLHDVQNTELGAESRSLTTGGSYTLIKTPSLLQPIPPYVKAATEMTSETKALWKMLLIFWEVQPWCEVCLRLLLSSGMYKGEIAFGLEKKPYIPLYPSGLVEHGRDRECWPSASATLLKVREGLAGS